MREIPIPPTFEGWRDAARRLLAQGVSPAEVVWRDSGASAANVTSAADSWGVGIELTAAIATVGGLEFELVRFAPPG